MRIGIVELVLLPVGAFLVFAVFVFSAVRRLQAKFGPEEQPNLWTYLNELGGYIAVAILLLGAWIASLFAY
jgi:hypothetical protein